jgi:hypothetical protein
VLCAKGMHLWMPAGGFNPQFFPSLDSISTLFSRPATAASFLLHILAINLFLGRRIYLDGAWCCSGCGRWRAHDSCTRKKCSGACACAAGLQSRPCIEKPKPNPTWQGKVFLSKGRGLQLSCCVRGAGLASGVPTWHSLIVASAFGPLALLVHWLTRVSQQLVRTCCTCTSHCCGTSPHNH